MNSVYDASEWYRRLMYQRKLSVSRPTLRSETVSLAQPLSARAHRPQVESALQILVQTRRLFVTQPACLPTKALQSCHGSATIPYVCVTVTRRCSASHECFSGTRPFRQSGPSLGAHPRWACTSA